MTRIVQASTTVRRDLSSGAYCNCKSMIVSAVGGLLLLLVACNHLGATDPPIPNVPDVTSVFGNTYSSTCNGHWSTCLTLPLPLCGGYVVGPGETLPARSSAPIYFRQGAAVEDVVDLQVPGASGLDFMVRRSYSSRVEGSALLGGKWLANLGERRLVQQAGSDVALIVDATSKRVFTLNLGYYTAPGDSTLSLVHDAANYQYVLTNWLTGEVDIFHDFSGSNPGRLKERTTLTWRGRAGTRYSYENSQLTEITTAAGQSYTIVFTYTGDTISKIEVRTGVGTSTRIQEVEYTYYNSQSHSADLGSDGDLVQVRVGRLRSGGSADTAAD